MKNELNEQERMLVEYRENLTNLRQDFDAVYWPIKQKEPEISRIKLELENKQSNLENNVTEIRNDINSIQSSLNVLDNFLSSRLISQDYNYSRGIISSVRNDLNSINSNLENIESNDYNEIISLLNDFELIIKKLDSIKSLLDKLDYDLANSIENTRQGQLRVNNFIEELNNAEQEINLFKNNMPSSSVSFEFKKAINISNDPVLIAFPFLVAIIITFTSLVISNIFVLKQVNQASYLRDISTPVKDHNFLIAEYLVNLFFILIQVLVLFVLGFYWFNIPLELFIPFTLSIFLVSTTFIFLGMSLGYLIKSQNLSMLITIFCVMALLIFSDLLVPAILSGPFIKFFVSLNPFLILKIILQNILIFNTGFKLLSPEGIWVIFSIIISMVILIVSRKHSKKKVEC